MAGGARAGAEPTGDLLPGVFLIPSVANRVEQHGLGLADKATSTEMDGPASPNSIGARVRIKFVAASSMRAAVPSSMYGVMASSRRGSRNLNPRSGTGSSLRILLGGSRGSSGLSRSLDSGRVRSPLRSFAIGISVY